MNRQKRKTAVPRLRVGANAEALLRTMSTAADPMKLRRLSMDPTGRAELERLQRVAAARVAEFEGALQLARSLEATFTDALNAREACK